MIETGSKKIFRSNTIGPPTQADTRRRVMIIGRPKPSQEEPMVSATQRRLAYSQSLRERRIKTRMQLPSLQLETPSISTSLSYRSSTSLIHSAFRNSKHNASSRALDFTA